MRLGSWNAQIRDEAPDDESGLRDWLGRHEVTGYAQQLLVHERFGYPDFFTRTGDELVDEQYADRPALRPIHDAVMFVLPEIGETTVQARKTYVSPLTPRRTFAVVAPTTKTRVDLGLRRDDPVESPRLSPAGSRLGSMVTVKVELHGLDDLDDELVGWLESAYQANR